MLNKDQYNHDEYNDYYARATQNAEIRHGGGEGNNSKKIILILLLLLLIGALAYFVMQGGETESYKKAEATQTESVAQEITVPQQTPAQPAQTTVQKDITKKVAEQVVAQSAANGNTMDSAQMAQIVQAVMAAMNEKNQQAQSGTAPMASTPQDTSLMQTLSEADEDILSIPDTLEPISESETQKQASTSETVDTYNKVLINQNAASNDALSQLSDELSNVLETDTGTNSSQYTQAIKSEVTERTKEMRYYVVKQGDTLGKIANEVYGNVMDYKKIYAANPDILRRPDKIYVGQKLRIPE